MPNYFQYMADCLQQIGEQGGTILIPKSLELSDGYDYPQEFAEDLKWSLDYVGAEPAQVQQVAEGYMVHHPGNKLFPYMAKHLREIDEKYFTVVPKCHNDVTFTGYENLSLDDSEMIFNYLYEFLAGLKCTVYKNDVLFMGWYVELIP